jgi:hypothetical protein
MGLRVYEPDSVWAVMEWALMGRDCGGVCPPFSACDMSWAKSASLVESPVKGSGCSASRPARRREGIAARETTKDGEGAAKMLVHT